MKKKVLYQEIARNIAWQIKKSVWKVGEKLPSLRTISNENGVSLNTAIQAYYELEKDGYIISRPKSGYIVNYKPIRLSAPATTQPSVKYESKEVVELICGKTFFRASGSMPVSGFVGSSKTRNPKLLASCNIPK